MQKKTGCRKGHHPAVLLCTGLFRQIICATQDREHIWAVVKNPKRTKNLKIRGLTLFCSNQNYRKQRS